MISKYFNPDTDFGFKKLFGEEGSKDLLIDFLNHTVLQKGFEIAEVSHLSSDQYDAYLKSVLSYNEAKAVTDTAFQDGERAKAIDVAKSMLAEHFDVETIARISKLSAFEIEALLKVMT